MAFESIGQPVDFGAYLNQPQQPLAGQAGQAMAQADQTRQLQIAVVQRQAQQQQALAAARQTAIKNPTTQNLAALQILDPEHADAIKSAHQALSQDQQNQNLRQMAGVQSYLQAGRVNDAAAIVQRRLDADKAAGLPIDDDQQLLDLITNAPDDAKGVVAHQLFSILGPDKYTAAVKDEGDAVRADAKLPGELAKTDAETVLTNAKVGSEKATAGKTIAETAEVAPNAVSERGLKGAQAANYRSEIVDRGARLAMAKDAEGAEAPLSPEGVAMIGQQYLSQGAPALANLGQGPTGVKNKNAILNWAAATAKEAGTTNPELVARFASNKANQAALTQNTKALTAITGSEHTLEANLDLAMGLAKKGVGPTGVPLLDMPINKARSGLGSADAKTLDNLLTTTANEYARILTTATGAGGGATSDSARAEANKMINSGMTLRQLTEAVKAAKAEAGNRRISIANESGRLVGEISGVKQDQQAPITALPGSTPSAGGQAPVQVTSPAQASALPKGTQFITPDGQVRVRH